MGTKITKSNAKSAIKDDKAHIDYLKRDVKDDQDGGGKYKDINQTADEIHISKLASDIKGDKSFLSKHWSHSSPLNQVGSAGEFNTDHVAMGEDQIALEQSYMDDVPDKIQHKQVIADTNLTEEPDSSDFSKFTDFDPGKITSPDIKLDKDGNPIKFVDIAEGEVDGVAYGAADVDGHIAVDTATVGYDDTINLP